VVIMANQRIYTNPVIIAVRTDRITRDKIQKIAKKKKISLNSMINELFAKIGRD